MTESTADYSSLGNQLLLLGLAVVVFALWGLAKVLPVLSGLFRQRGYNKQTVAPTVVPVAPKQATQRYDEEVNTHRIDMGWWEAIINPKSLHAHNLMIVGQQDSGKTTTARAIAKYRSHVGNFIIIDPKGTPEKWGNIKAVGAGAKWGEINKMFLLLIDEQAKRYEQQARGNYKQKLLTIVVDEFNACADECEAAGLFIRRFATMAREANMPIILLNHSSLVKGLKLEGRGDIRDNFAFLSLGNKAREKDPSLTGKHPAYYEWNGFAGAVDNSFIPQYEKMEFNFNNVWQSEKPIEIKAPLILSGVSRFPPSEKYPSFEPVITQNGRETAQGNARETQEGNGGETDLEERKHLIKCAILGGMSQRVAMSLIRGKTEINAVLWRQVKQELEG